MTPHNEKTCYSPCHFPELPHPQTHCEECEKVKTSQEVLMNLEIDKTKKTLSPPLSEPIKQDWEKDLTKIIERYQDNFGKALQSRKMTLEMKEAAKVDLQAFFDFTKSLLLQERKNSEEITRRNLEEIRLIIESWLKELNIIKDWPKDLHPADILEKHVFPATEDQIKKGCKEERENIRGELLAKGDHDQGDFFIRQDLFDEIFPNPQN